MTKNCPYCGLKFNLWQRAIGEDREHIRICAEHRRPVESTIARAMNCRGCPAGCYERVDFGAQGNDLSQD